MLDFELQRGDQEALLAVSDSALQIQRPEGGKEYAFSAVFRSTSTQAEVFGNSGVKDLLESALDGYSVTILAYGQTGSGKTYT